MLFRSNADYYKNNSAKYRNDKCVNLDNLEEKLNKYINLGGSYSFANKIKIKAEEIFNKKIEIKENDIESRAKENIANKRYIEIINDISFCACKNMKIAETYRNFALNDTSEIKNIKTAFNYIYENKINIETVKMKKAIKELYHLSAYKTDKNNNFYIDIDEINKVKDKYIKEFKTIKDKRKEVTEEKKIEDILNQKELRIYCKENAIIDLKKHTGKTELELLFDNNLQNIVKNTKNMTEKEKLNYIENKANLSQNWKESIIKKLIDTTDRKERMRKEISNILTEKELRTYCKDNRIESLEKLTGYTETRILYKNNLEYARSKKRDYTKQEIIEMYLNKELKDDIERRIDNLKLNTSENFTKKIKTEIIKETYKEHKVILEEFDIMRLELAYIRAKAYNNYMQVLKKAKEHLAKTNDIKTMPQNFRDIDEIERKLKKYETKNYINYLDEKHILDKAIEQYKEKYNIRGELQNLKTKEYEKNGKKVYIYEVKDKVYSSDIKFESSKEIIAGMNSKSYRNLDNAERDCENHGYTKSKKQLEIEELERAIKKSKYLER